MFKQIFLSLVAVLAMALPSVGQSVGQWYIYPRFDGTAQYIVDSPSIVYYVSGGSLYSFNKNDNETFSYSTQNKLSDNNITVAKYNHDGKYLFVAYSNGNIDLVYDNGRVINMPDIKDAVLTTRKTINDADFANGKIYVGTNFGLVVFDDARHEVIESGIFNKNLKSVSASKDNILVFSSTDYAIYRSSMSDRHNTWDNFHRWIGRSPSHMVSAGEDLFIVTDGTLNFVDLNWTILDFTLNPLSDVTGVKSVDRDADGNLHVQTTDNLFTIDPTGNILSKTALDDAVKNQTLAYHRDFNSVWGLDADGLANYDLTSSPVTVLSDKSAPQATTIDEVAYLNASADGTRIYASNLGATRFKSIGGPGDGTENVQRTDCFINGVPHNAALHVCHHLTSESYIMQQRHNSTLMYGGLARLAVDPDDPDKYYVCNTIDGVFVIKDNEQLGLFNSLNSPIRPSWGANSARAFDVFFDKEGNLWVGAIYPRDVYSPYVILPKAKVNSDLSKITIDDWVQLKNFIGIWNPDKEVFGVLTKKDGILITSSSAWYGDVYVLDTRGTLLNTEDDVVKAWSSFIDQDGNSFSAERWVCGVEDKKGRVWFGTTSGVIEFTDPSKFTSQSARIKRLKVPRNDGTGLADYLLSTDMINDIAIDDLNRKWIATENSGVFLVSEDGDKILQNFNTSNSPLPSNSVYSVLCDPLSNDIYFGMKTGVIRYSSTASPAASDLSNVYAYPNPVRPEYTGWITIAGLMENTLVKITDAGGNVVHQGRSEGGMLSWDGCDPSGNRVRSGVYLVFASNNNDGSSSGAVTKFVVIN